jgi:hypothetical protein
MKCDFMMKMGYPDVLKISTGAVAADIHFKIGIVKQFKHYFLHLFLITCLSGRRKYR